VQDFDDEEVTNNKVTVFKSFCVVEISKELFCFEVTKEHSSVTEVMEI